MEATLRGQSASIRSPPALEVGKNAARLPLTAEPLPGKWVVDCKRVGNGEKALVYLGRYLYRGVIREADLLACDHDGSGQVSFRYRDSQSGESKVRTLPGADFLRLLLQHVRYRSLSGVLCPPAPTRNNPSHIHQGGAGSDQGDSDQQQVAAA
ncbi:MAG: transposase [Gammaproteobacteria bacterium]|nr:transposase [Gammaproteobacteria bacterium]